MLVPELDVTDLARSLHFYTTAFGFRVLFEREPERFAYIERDGAELMVQEAVGPGRRFRTAPLEAPFGRGINFQLLVNDVDDVYARVVDSGAAVTVELEERWYRVDVATSAGRWSATGPTVTGNRQFVVADPDGYLWRPYSDLGVRSESSATQPL